MFPIISVYALFYAKFWRIFWCKNLLGYKWSVRITHFMLPFLASVIVFPSIAIKRKTNIFFISFFSKLIFGWMPNTCLNVTSCNKLLSFQSGSRLVRYICWSQSTVNALPKSFENLGTESCWRVIFGTHYVAW